MARKSEIRQFYLFEALGKNSLLRTGDGLDEDEETRPVASSSTSSISPAQIFCPERAIVLKSKFRALGRRPIRGGPAILDLKFHVTQHQAALRPWLFEIRVAHCQSHLQCVAAQSW